jgi:hypothetical protein
MARPHQPCPVCGRDVFVCNLASHVGSQPCVVELYRRDGNHASPKYGPQAERLARALGEVLRDARAQEAAPVRPKELP